MRLIVPSLMLISSSVSRPSGLSLVFTSWAGIRSAYTPGIKWNSALGDVERLDQIEILPILLYKRTYQIPVCPAEPSPSKPLDDMICQLQIGRRRFHC